MAIWTRSWRLGWNNRSRPDVVRLSPFTFHLGFEMGLHRLDDLSGVSTPG